MAAEKPVNEYSDPPTFLRATTTVVCGAGISGQSPDESTFVPRDVAVKLSHLERLLDREPFLDRLNDLILDISYHGLPFLYYYLYVFQHKPCLILAPLLEPQRLHVWRLLSCIYNVNERSYDALHMMRLQWSSRERTTHVAMPVDMQDECFLTALEGCTAHIILAYQQPPKWTRIGAHFLPLVSAASTVHARRICTWAITHMSLTAALAKWAKTDFKLETPSSDLVRWSHVVLRLERAYGFLGLVCTHTVLRHTGMNRCHLWRLLMFAAVGKHEWTTVVQLMDFAATKTRIWQFFCLSIPLFLSQMYAREYTRSVERWIDGDVACEEGRMIRHIWTCFLQHGKIPSSACSDFMQRHWSVLFPLRAASSEPSSLH
jgi:hypothetical protein